ncbi:unnamed protein product [Dibothriocephalus latus]|uniref:Uncharacterized protein n=1 Tax=Dibothriocephalus latus TaxID=60516 RepID=A0A3P7PD95_DIBLA|nr:unnamed protein product [Dibothriocephalus latus]
MIEQYSSSCRSILTAHEPGTLEATTLDTARRHRKLRDDQLSVKFEKISPPKQPSPDGVLVHNLSSPPVSPQQLAVISYDPKFSMRDARPEDFIAALESALQKCEAAEERELLKIRKIENIVTLPIDKGRSTVIMDKVEYGAKLNDLLMDKESHAPLTASDFKKLVNNINKAVDKLKKSGTLTRREALAAKATDAAMAHFYGLTKVRKPGVPLRPIVSLRGILKVAVSTIVLPHQRFKIHNEVC